MRAMWLPAPPTRCPMAAAASSGSVHRQPAHLHGTASSVPGASDPNGSDALLRQRPGRGEGHGNGADDTGERPGADTDGQQQRKWLSDRANSQLEALLASRRTTALKAARKAATAPRGPPSAAAFAGVDVPPAADLGSAEGAKTGAAQQIDGRTTGNRDGRSGGTPRSGSRSALLSSAQPITSSSSVQQTAVTDGTTRLYYPTTHRQPTQAQRAAQREVALDRQRATAAVAQMGPLDAAAAFPAKNPAKQRPLLEGQRMVDIRMYEQVAASRNRMAQQLSAANRHVTFLESALESRRGEVAAAMDSMRTLTQDLAKLEGLVTSVSAAALHGLDRTDTQRKVDLVLQRIESITKTAEASRSDLDRLVAREVPVSWFGLASQVKLMGDFDGWSRGVDLAAEDTTGDSVFTRFTATLLLPKGEYQVKFQVDGEWRLAPDWPQVDDADGSQNNVLEIE